MWKGCGLVVGQEGGLIKKSEGVSIVDQDGVWLIADLECV